MNTSTAIAVLNSQRAAEEVRGQIRWLRPEYQNPSAAAPQQAEGELEVNDQASPEPVAKLKKITRPKVCANKSPPRSTRWAIKQFP